MKKMLMIVALVGVIAMAGPAYATAYNDAVLADNPYLYWTFDEAGDTADAVSLVNAAPMFDLVSIAGGTRTTSGATPGGVSLGRAATSPLSNSRFSTLELGAPTVSTAWAVEFWVYLADDAWGQYIMAVSDESPAFLYGFDPNGPQELEMHAAWSGARLGETGVSVGEWHHVVAAWYENVANEEIYVDGALGASSGGYSSWLPLEVFTVGSRPWGFDGAFTGSVDEVAIYILSGDLAAQQAAVADIADHYNVAPAAVVVPEPAGLGLMGLALLAVRRKRS